jgi:hypothetical protein
MLNPLMECITDLLWSASQRSCKRADGVAVPDSCTSQGPHFGRRMRYLVGTHEWPKSLVRGAREPIDLSEQLTQLAKLRADGALSKPRPCRPMAGEIERVVDAAASGSCGSCAYHRVPSGVLFWNFKLREGVKFSDATASPSDALFWNRMVTCTDSSSLDVLTVPGACVARRNILSLRGSISATKPRTPRPMAYSCRRACRPFQRLAPATPGLP